MTHRIDNVPPLATTGIPRFGTRLGGFVRLIARWLQTAQTRRDLARLSDHQLRDIGLTREDVTNELEKPFWH